VTVSIGHTSDKQYLYHVLSKHTKLLLNVTVSDNLGIDLVGNEHNH